MLPTRPIERSSDLVGLTNGKIPADRLVVIPSLSGGPDIRLLPHAARAFVAMRAAARAAGHDLDAGSGGSFRSYDDQVRIFRERYTTTPRANTDVKVWNGAKWYRKAGVATAAAPGTSNHGWAQAIDLGDPPLAWLVANEERFGWSHEIQSENWHIHYFAGDALTAAVVDYEAGQHQNTTQPEDDDDMKATLSWLQKEGHAPALYLCDGAVGAWVHGPGAAAIAKMRGAVPDGSSKTKPQAPEFLNQIHLLDGPLS